MIYFVRNGVMLLLLLQGKEVLSGIDDPTADPLRRFYSNTMSPEQNNDLPMVLDCTMLLLLLLLQRKEVLPGSEDLTADPLRRFYSNTMSP